MQINNLTLIIGGDAGQGVESSGAGFCKALSRAGLHVTSIQDHRSRIRGGHNFYLIKTSDKPITSWSEPVHLLVALTAESIEIHRDKMVPGSAVIFDSETTINTTELEKLSINPVSVPLNQIAKDVGGSSVMANTAALGAVAGLTQFPLKTIHNVIEENFRKKGANVVESNRQVSQAAYDYVRQNYTFSYQWQLNPIDAPERMVMNGNDGIALGALCAGCNFISAYPMTPATSIFLWLTARAEEFAIVSKQTEDEISAINMGIGAAHAGARVIVPTSGGGFSLMVEALGMAGIMEIPIVIALVQRTGPSTGFATRTEQSDLLFAIHASQGEFPRIVIAPGTIEQCFEETGRAFNLADKYQLPVIIISDATLASSSRTLEKSAINLSANPIDRGKLLTDEQLYHLSGEYKRYAFAESGISDRALPGHPKAIFATTSDEHDELGHITEDAQNRIRMQSKRMQKLDTALTDMKPPLRYGPEKADITFVCWGATLAPVLEAMNRLNQNNKNTANTLQFIDLWPLPVTKVQPYLEQAGKLIAVEANYTGQLAMLIRMCTGVAVAGKITKFDGRPISPEYILSNLKEVR
ncbi:2-oxoacid:acceptor oxidoreductase subunit alpha [candidate division KSB1 bacterium]|nr:2-oxoacid:acceptor oxidoreductase subunit alpha [candidate division KSB1 bacterium]